MTTVDGLSFPVRLAIDGDAFDAASHYAREHGLTISQAASEMLRTFALPVETLPATALPGDGREGGPSPSGPPSMLTLEQSKALHPSSRPAVKYVAQCVYCGERSQHGRCS